MEWKGLKLGVGIGVAALCGVTMMNPGSAHGQAGPQTELIPSLSASERYDSNVYFIPGRNLEDYVTTISPQVRVVHRRQLLEATASGGFTAEAYAKNPGLNYVGVNGLIDVNLDGVMSELVRGLGLKISDAFSYTPQTSAFAPTTGSGELSSAFARGIQAQRANSFTNGGRVAASYAVSPLLSLTTTYLDQRIRFGNPITAPSGAVRQGGFLDTNFQTVTAGPMLRVSPLDTVTLLYQYQKGTFDQAGGGTSGFSTQGATVGWTRLVTPTLTANMMGGVTVLSASNGPQYVGSASLLWKGQDADLTLSYTRVIAPSFYVVAAALLSQVVAAVATYHVIEPLSISISGNYARSESVPDPSLMKFESYSVTPNVVYRVNRIMTATLSYTYSLYDQTALSQGVSFDRNLIMLRMVAEWK